MFTEKFVTGIKFYGSDLFHSMSIDYPQNLLFKESLVNLKFKFFH